MSWFVALLVACSAPVEVPAPEVEPEVEAQPEPEREPEPLADPTEEKLAATHLLVAYQGAVGAPAGVSRSRDEARELAAALLAEASPTTLPDLAREHSDDPTGRRGGRLGVWRTGRMALAFERCVSAAGIGEIGPLCETPFGFHVLRRDPIDEASGTRITIRYPEGGRDAALASLVSIRDALSKGHEVDEAITNTDARAVDLEDVGPGQLVPDVEKALFGLDPGAVSEPVETPGALHLLVRR